MARDAVLRLTGNSSLLQLIQSATEIEHSHRIMSVIRLTRHPFRL
jgi:hypothetical protein